MISPHDKFAKDYDDQIEKYNCWLAEVIFGLCYEDIISGETVLDVGIGTGLSSRLFHLAGLKIFGIDGSNEMLSICRTRGIASELVHQDILLLPWPYQNSSIKHVVSCGVFHFIGELDSIFAEMARVQEQNGLLLFTIMKSDQPLGDFQNFEERTNEGIPVFSHSDKYVQGLLDKYDYERTKEIVCFVRDTPFRVICSRKNGA